MRTITLELLRHGPRHNQLLSPLTQYLALCENHPAVTVTVPFEHNQLRHRLDNLSYVHDDTVRDFEIVDTARILGELLAQIPGLTAELGNVSNDKQAPTHLRLIVSAAELALLPFEMALSPNGFPGAGQPLSLQSQVPIYITREVRRVPERTSLWLRKPKILVVAASPEGYPPVPLKAHILALRKALDPWLPPFDSSAKLEEQITILTNASDEAIEDACARHDFTHVHILAHGVQDTINYDVRYGIALHHPRTPGGPAVIASGARLATILRAAKRPEATSLAAPTVVTLASCNSSNGGTVTGVGASVAHALHDAGIPIVVSSQFPLSFGGSVRMVETLYGGLLWGEDPRLLLGDLRRRLHSQFPDNHDWASITAYAALTQTLDADLLKFKVEQARRCVEAAFAAVDKMKLYDSVTRRKRKLLEADGNVFLPEGAKSATKAKIELAKSKLSALLEIGEIDKASIYGKLASTEKRLAEIDLSEGVVSVKLLKRAKDYYWRAFQGQRTNSWGIVQYLSLHVVIARLKSEYGGSSMQIPASEKEKSLWNLAHAISKQDEISEDTELSGWAMGNLIELYLLATIVEDIAEQDDYQSKALDLANRFVEREGEESFEIYSTQRQMARYEVWYHNIADLSDGILLGQRLVDILQSTWEED